MKQKLICLLCLLISPILFFSACDFSALPLSLSVENAPVFIIDPGHGGVDGGAISFDRKTIEKDINLSIALKVRYLLSAYGFSTRMTREDDRSIHDEGAVTVREQKVSDLQNRLKMVEDTPNAVLLSIHQNKFEKSSSSGTQVFFSLGNPESALFAEEIQVAVRNMLQTGNNRLIKPSSSSIYILYKATKPAVMVECGFLSNPADTKNLKDEAYQRRLAFSIVVGAINYLNARTENTEPNTEN